MSWTAYHVPLWIYQVWLRPFGLTLTGLRFPLLRELACPYGLISLFLKKRCYFSITHCVLSHFRDCRKFVHILFLWSVMRLPPLWVLGLRPLWPRLNLALVRFHSSRIFSALLCQRLFSEPDPALALCVFNPLRGLQKHALIGRQR